MRSIGDLATITRLTLRHVRRRAVDAVENRAAIRARLGRLRSEHEVVDKQRVLAALEQLRKLHGAARGIEDIVFSDRAAEWQLAALRRHFLGRPPQRDFILEKRVAGGTVLRRLTGEERALLLFLRHLTSNH
jgi:hypothetical protein